IIHSEAELFHHHVSRRRSAEPLYAEDIPAVTDITMPALRQSRFDRKPRPNRGWQNRLAIVARLQIVKFRARADQDDVGLAVRGISQNVGASSDSLRRGKLTPILGGDVLPR